MKKNELIVEWKHAGRDIGNTCERCSATGRAVMDVAERIRPILFNGVPLEDLIGGMEVTSTPCVSCACIAVQGDVECRAVEYNGERYESIPPEPIARAALKALGLE